MRRLEKEYRRQKRRRCEKKKGKTEKEKIEMGATEKAKK